MQYTRNRFLGRSVPTVTVVAPSYTRQPLNVEAAIKKASLRNIVCSKTLKVKDKSIDYVKKLCKNIGEFAIREMKDTSNGILSFEVFQDPYESKEIHFLERYTDNTKMGQFNTSDTFQKFLKDVQVHLEEPVGLALYECKNGQLGVAAVQGGPKGEGGLDDATGAGGRGGSSYKQTSDVVNLGDVKRGEEGDGFGLPFKLKLPWEKE